MFQHVKRMGVLSVAVALGASLAVSAPAFSAGDVTSATEKARVDAVATPVLDWYPCYPSLGDLRCATAELPLDYDKPHGPKVQIALVKHVATSPAKVGTLFVNPGGPGGAGTETAAFASLIFSKRLQDRFDIVGIDPRGIGYSDNVQCFDSVKNQLAALTGMSIPFPFTQAEKTAYLASAAKLATGCALTGRPLAASMSTAQVARDLDVLRRAVGDQKLNYLGWSYGTYLGQVYANMFPDRVRTLAIDGVLDPVAWAGTKQTQNTPVTLRIRAAEGAQRALDKVLDLCDAAGPERCANAGNAREKFRTAAARLQAHPLPMVNSDGRQFDYTYTYFVSDLLAVLYAQKDAAETVDRILGFVLAGTDQASSPTAQRTALSRLRTVRATLKSRVDAPSGFGFPYDNRLEAFSSVLCTDSLNPYDPAAWNTAIEQQAARVGDFARAWGWESAQCARRYWTTRDEDAYRGPFTKTTASPVLVVGNYYDPATNYDNAVAAADLLPNARLLSSDSWGHTAYGTSECATAAIDTYLIDQALPALGTTCRGDYQPFQGDPGTAGPSSTLSRPTDLRIPLPVRISGLPAAGVH